jgi:cytochrome c-type biogenesis protein CcmH/NrfG
LIAVSTPWEKFSSSDHLFIESGKLLQRGEAAAAVSVLSELLRENDKYGKGWYRLGSIMSEYLEDWNAAAECYRKCIEAEPAFAPAYVACAEALFHLGQYAEMNALINQALEFKDVKRDEALCLMAMLMESQQRFDEAITTWKQAILSAFSDDVISRCEKGILRCRTKKQYQ